MSIKEETNKFRYDLFKEKNMYFCNNFEAYLYGSSEDSEQNLLNILKKNNGKFNLENINKDYTFFNYLDYFLQLPNEHIKINFTFKLRDFFDLYSQFNTQIEFSMTNFKTISSRNHILLLPILLYRDSFSYESFNEYCEGQSYPLYISNLLNNKHKNALNGWLELMDLLQLPLEDQKLKNKLFYLNEDECSKTIYNISDINCIVFSTKYEQITALLTILDVNKNQDYIYKNPNYYITIINAINNSLNRDNDYEIHEKYLHTLHNIYPLNFVVQDKDCSEYLEFLLATYEKKYDSSYPLLLEFSEAKSNYEKWLLDNIIDNNIPTNKKNRI